MELSPDDQRDKCYSVLQGFPTQNFSGKIKKKKSYPKRCKTIWGMRQNEKEKKYISHLTKNEMMLI